MTVRRVLAIDDQPEILDVVRLALETTTDWTIDTRTTVDDATAAVEQPDVVLLDLRLDGGFVGDSITQLRHAGVIAPVLLLTGAPVEASEWRAAGAQGLIAKPFDPMTLADAIRAQLADPAQ